MPSIFFFTPNSLPFLFNYSFLVVFKMHECRTLTEFLQLYLVGSIHWCGMLVSWCFVQEQPIETRSHYVFEVKSQVNSVLWASVCLSGSLVCHIFSSRNPIYGPCWETLNKNTATASRSWLYIHLCVYLLCIKQGNRELKKKKIMQEKRRCHIWAIASWLYSGFLQTEHTCFNKIFRSGSAFGNWEVGMEEIGTMV